MEYQTQGNAIVFYVYLSEMNDIRLETDVAARNSLEPLSDQNRYRDTR